MKKIIIIIVYTIILSIRAGSSQAQNAADSLLKITVKVGNLHCSNDMPTIKKRLLNQDGIEEVSFTEISGESSVFTISYHSSATGPVQIEKAIESTPGCDDPADTPYQVKKEKTTKKKKP